eukprot:2810621-Pyramimonas_sp.AAC.1
MHRRLRLQVHAPPRLIFDRGPMTRAPEPARERADSRSDAHRRIADPSTTTRRSIADSDSRSTRPPE